MIKRIAIALVYVAIVAWLGFVAYHFTSAVMVELGTIT